MKKLLAIALSVIVVGCGEKKKEIGIYKFPYCEGQRLILGSDTNRNPLYYQFRIVQVDTISNK